MDGDFKKHDLDAIPIEELQKILETAKNTGLLGSQLASSAQTPVPSIINDEAADQEVFAIMKQQIESDDLSESESPCSPAFSPCESPTTFCDDSEVSIDSTEIVIAATSEHDSIEGTSALVDSEIITYDDFELSIDSRGVVIVAKNESDPLEGTSSSVFQHYDDSGISTDSSDVASVAKKRKADPSLWKANIRKEKLNKGEAYKNSFGAPVLAKTLKPPCAITCRQKCREKIDEEQRQKIFDGFYRNGVKTRQWDFLVSHVIASPAIVHRRNSKRLNSNVYYLPTGQTDVSKVRVCKVFFLNTLAITTQWITTAQDKRNRSVTLVSPDKRGKFSRPKSSSCVERDNLIMEHIQLFPRVPSHYCRAETTKVYLDPSLNVATMYRLYVDWVAEKGHGKEATLRQYRDLFNTLNIGFHTPKKDQCNKCTWFHNTPAEEITDEMKTSHDVHLANKELARSLKNQDKALSMTDPTFVTASFDFQKVLSTPAGQASLLYYKRKLAVYNFTIYHMGAKLGICNVWDESTGRRSANEVGSCLLRFMADEVEKGARQFAFYSDNCSGQNRNRFIYAAYAHFAQKHHVTVTHRFLEPGHTQMEADSVHAQIEKTQQHCKIFTPQQWYGVMASSKKSGQPYHVVEIDQSQIIDMKPFVSETNWDRTVVGKKPRWGMVKEIRIEGTRPNVVLLKNDLAASSYEEVVLYSNEPIKLRGKKKRKPFVYNPEIPLAYQTKLPISRLKYQDLMTLCAAGIIPKIYHEFYESLAVVDGDPEIEDNFKEES